MTSLKWIFRPAVLIGFSILLVVAATVVVFPFEGGAARPQPQPVSSGDLEIAWLYPATSATTWERFALALQQTRQRLHDAYPELRWELHQNETAHAQGTPEVALSWTRDGTTSRLLFRWYKLTSQWTPEAWVDALLARRPTPLAIVGGNNSHWARELARCLAAGTQDLPPTSRPLLLLTTATADRVPLVEGRDRWGPSSGEAVSARWIDDARTVVLTSIYADRTFRFCFSNRQMATAVTRFLWTRPDLCPDADPAFLVQWTDDAYSQDLFAGYIRVLDHRAADSFLDQWGFVSGALTLGLPAPALAGWHTSAFRHETTVLLDVDSSVGTFASPNPYESKVVRDLLSQVGPVPRRPLLVLTGQQQPSRRLLRDLARSAPDTARRFVVAMGDALSFNTIFRDRQVTWPIQDLPFCLVHFAHRNPVDESAGFQASGGGSLRSPTGSSGTEDVLLFRDITEACALALLRDGGSQSTPVELAEGLQAVRFVEGRLTLGSVGVPFFATNGQRTGGTGEHVVHIQPQFVGERVLPRATIEVWARQAPRGWIRAAKPLVISFNEFEVQHGDRPQ
ncbi:MAG: hypothetical protein U0840_04370 [Gemmataceae bacterium]